MGKLNKKPDFDSLNTVEAFACYCSCGCECGCVCYPGEDSDNDSYDDRTGEDKSSDSFTNKQYTLES